jgi:hypothetical protein
VKVQVDPAAAQAANTRASDGDGSEPDGAALCVRLSPPFQRELGHCWIFGLEALPEAAVLAAMADNEERSRQSKLQLYENEQRLGPGHAQHLAIREVGRGAFSHWKDSFYFSTSDNSDPNFNGRRYELRVGPDPSDDARDAGPEVWEDSADSVHEHGHRESVGGLWGQIGRLQFEFLVKAGLRPADTLLDLACGSLRAGIHFIRYLDPGHYLGIDKRIELVVYGVSLELGIEDYRKKRPRFVISDAFEFERFDERPNFGIGQSIFTHLAAADIVRCLQKLKPRATGDCRFFATFREVTEPQQNPAQSHSHAVFDYTRAQMTQLAAEAGWKFRYLGDWGHPRDLKMAEFRPLPD